MPQRAAGRMRVASVDISTTRKIAREPWPGTSNNVAFGPAPISHELQRPWLLSGKPNGGISRGPQTLPDPPPSYMGSPLSTARTSGRKRLQEPRRRAKDHAVQRSGPCEERSLPLRRHAAKKAGPSRSPWMPTQEWRIASSPRVPEDAFSPVSLAGLLSPRVIRQCYEREDEEMRQLERSFFRPGSHGPAASTHETGGGWAAEMPISGLRSPVPVGENSGQDVDPHSRWPPSFTAHQPLPLAPLAVVDDFLSGGIAALFTDPG